MKTHRVILRLGHGSLIDGFSSASVEWIDQHGTQLVWQGGKLPANYQLMMLYQRWRKLYRAHYFQRSLISTRLEFVPKSDSVIESSMRDLQECCTDLNGALEDWLTSPEFLALSHLIRARLPPNESCQWIIESQDSIIQNLPWHQWTFFQDYPLAAYSIGLPQEEKLQHIIRDSESELKVLVILGTPLSPSGQRIDVETDRKILESIPQVSTVVFNQISLSKLADLLREQDWNVILFSGHSHKASSDERAAFLLASEGAKHLMTISKLESAFQAAIQRGLKLVLFNSCNSVELGLDLLKLNLPICIAMSEVVPDVVAQRFLSYLVQQWQINKSLMLAFRNARTRLRESEDPHLPCASWIPIMCQNPSAEPPSWPA